ncbi:heme/copper-type cytochrome/quinol oxidase subunit 1 [Bradyrhizobium sp. LB7.1]
MLVNRKLILAHFWLAFAVFGIALTLGAWQMFIRSPIGTWLSNPELYYRSLTAHGTVMGYVFPTLVAMGFGYAISESALEQRLVGVRWAWAGFWLIVVGAIMAMVPVGLGRASVLYTFYPPLIGNVFYYLGVVLVVVGSWFWVALMSINLRVWRKAHPGAPVPLAMFANVAGSYLWAWTAVGAALELLLQIIPVAAGLKATIDAGLARVFFSWTLHAIVYFWLMPTYIAYYTIVPRAIGGRVYSDSMARISFILFLVVAMPIGMHHTFADPQVGAGFKFIHSAFTALVALPTLLTVVHHLRVGRDRRAPAWRPRHVRLDQGPAVGQPDDAGACLLLCHARFRRCRRPHQHELPARCVDPQHAVDHRPFPPDLRRRHRDHVFCDRL